MVRASPRREMAKQVVKARQTAMFRVDLRDPDGGREAGRTQNSYKPPLTDRHLARKAATPS